MTRQLPPFRPVDPGPVTWRRGLSAGAAGGLVAASVAAVLVLCGVPVFGFVVWYYGGPRISDVSEVADRYLQRIEAGDDAAAYRMVCSESRRALTQQDFTAAVQAGPRPAHHAVISSGFSGEARHHAFIDLRLIDPDGRTRQLDLDLDDADGEWQVCGDPLI